MTVLGRADRVARDIGQFLRLPLAITTLVPSVVGAFWTARAPNAADVTLAIGFGLGVHLFSAVQNDLADLEVDRTSARRSVMPLPSGRAPLWLAHTVVLLGASSVLLIPLLLHAWTALALAAAVLLGFAFYNYRGRTDSHPLLADAVCGLAYASPAPVACALAGRLDLAVLVWTVGYGLLVALYTGFYGGFRDYENDRMHGRITTAGWLLAFAPTVSGPRVRRAGPVGTAGIATACVVTGVAAVLVSGPQRLVPTLGAWALAVVPALVLAHRGHRAFPDLEAVVRPTVVMLPLTYVGALAPVVAFGHPVPWLVCTAALVLVSVLSPTGRGRAEQGFGRSVAGATVRSDHV